MYCMSKGSRNVYSVARLIYLAMVVKSLNITVYILRLLDSRAVKDFRSL